LGGKQIVDFYPRVNVKTIQEDELRSLDPTLESLINVNTPKELLLIRRFKSGDTGSFEELVNMFRDKGYNLAYQWTNNQEDALDVLQEAFIKMHKVIPKWKPDS
jgi:RNA polymerase sigma-70 factor (ECF subfamily)